MATKKASTSKKTSVRKRIDIRSIRKRAQEIFLKRNEEGVPGDAESDWLQAEKELMNQ